MKTKQENRPDKVSAGSTMSCWYDPMVNGLKHQQLENNMECDAVIVGGGLAGVSIAYCLSKQGQRVVLVEDGLLGSGETGRTTAELVTALDNRYYELEHIFGEEKTKLIAESHREAIDFVERVIQDEKIDCDFARVPGYLFLHPSDKKGSLETETEAARRAGLDVIMVEEMPGIDRNRQKGIRFDNQAQFHPLKYLAGLSNAVLLNGGHIFTETHADEINHEGIVTSKGFRVKANHVIVATNSPVNSKYMIPLKQDATRTYVIGSLVKKYLLPKAFWWDTGNHKSESKMPPYHYARLVAHDDQHDLLLVGGEDHPVADTGEGTKAEKHYADLEKWTHKHFDVGETIFNWSGQVMEPMDAIAFIGRNPLDKKNVYIATGASGTGMTYCTIAGILITDLILGKENKWEKIYSPSRFKVSESGPVFSKLTDTVKGAVKSLTKKHHDTLRTTLKKGEGKIIHLENEPYGVFRSKDDHLHMVSAKCTHLGCTVAWNPGEQSWDCPCHGSRFTYDGKVINGPANDDLKMYNSNSILSVKHPTE